MRVRHLLLALTLALTLPAQAPAQSSSPQSSSPKAMLPDLPLPILQSLSYVDIAAGKALPLKDGVYADARRALRLEPGLIAHGDLDGDATRDAAVLLEDRDAASGATTLHVAAVVQRAGRVRNMASLRLGQDVQVRSLAIEDRLALLSLLVMGEGDAAGRPTLKMTLALKLAGSEWLIMRQEPGGRFTIAELAGTSWKLSGSPHGITAEFRRDNDGALRLFGRAACNFYAARFDESGAATDIATGPTLSTKRDCPPEAAEAERVFLAALASARRIEFRFGRLALAGGEGGTVVWQAN